MQQVDDDAVLKSFVDLCESSPKFLRPQIGGVIQLCLKVLSLFFLLESLNAFFFCVLKVSILLLFFLGIFRRRNGR